MKFEEAEEYMDRVVAALPRAGTAADSAKILCNVLASVVVIGQLDRQDVHRFLDEALESMSTGSKN